MMSKSDDDPSMVKIKNSLPTPEYLGDPLGLSDMINYVQALSTEVRVVFILHSEAVRDQLLFNRKVRNALDKFLWELAKDEELGDELRKRNPNRYAKP